MALAILGLSAFHDHQTVRAWKGMDRDVLAVLYQNGWIADPRMKARDNRTAISGLIPARPFKMPDKVFRLTPSDRAAW